MANDRKRKEAKRNRLREKRGESKDSQSSTVPTADSQASCSNVKRRRLDSSADSSVSVRSNASTTSERKRKYRENMTEDQKAAVRAKDAERKRRSRASQSEAKKAADRAMNEDQMRRSRAEMPDNQVAVDRERDAERKRQHRAEMPDNQVTVGRERDAERKRQHRAEMPEDQVTVGRERDADRMRFNRAEMSEDQMAVARVRDAERKRQIQSITPRESTEQYNLARKEQRHELAEMRESLLTPPDSSTATRAQTNEDGFRLPFFQSTKGVCFCRTALNNALGGNVFSYQTLGVQNIDHVNVEMTEEAISAKLESMGLKCDTMNNVRDLVSLSEIATVGTWILRNNNTGGHYVVLKRLHIDAPLWLLDSAKQEPVVSPSYFYDILENLRTEEDLRNLFVLYIRFPDGYVPQCIQNRSEITIRRMLTTNPTTPSLSRTPVPNRSNLITALTSISSANPTTDRTPHPIENNDEPIESAQPENTLPPEYELNPNGVTFDSAKISFDERVSNLKIRQCVRCKEGHLIENNLPGLYNCHRCTTSRSSWFTSDYANPRLAPSYLPRLTLVESQLISPVAIQQLIYRRGYNGPIATKGHCCAVSNDIMNVVKILPRVAQDVPIIIIKQAGTNFIPNRDFIVRQSVIRQWLLWLKANNRTPIFRDLVISEHNLSLLPENEEIAGLRTIETEEIVDVSPNMENAQLDDSAEEPTDPVSQLSQGIARSCSITQDISEIITSQQDVHLPEQIQEDTTYTGLNMPLRNVPLEHEAVRNLLGNVIQGERIVNMEPPVFHIPPPGDHRLNEYNTLWLGVYMFPDLFPYGQGDPFGISPGHRTVSDNMKFRHLLHYCAYENNKLVFPFQRHHRFVLFINNLKYRHQMNEQGKVFLAHRPEHANKTVEELRESVALNSHNPILRDMSRYIANIPGTPCYWRTACDELLAIIHCRGAPTIFGTLTFADHYDPYLFELLQIDPAFSVNKIKEILLEKPAIVESYFVQKWNIFREEVLVKMYGCCPELGGWYWGRAEWQHRGTVHFHYLAKMTNKLPDPYKLAANCLNGKHTAYDVVKTPEQQAIFDLWKQSEEDLISFNDFLLCSDVSEDITNYVPPQREQLRPMHKKCVDIPPEEVYQDNLDLVMVVNIHKYCKVGSCRKMFGNKLGNCRFKFPKRLTPSGRTEIQYKMSRYGNKFELELIPKRVHYDRVVSHIPNFLRLWRANVEASLIYDLRKVVKYIAKYASKPEKKSNPVNDSFKHIMNMVNDPTQATTHSLLIKTMQRVLSERDVTVSESCHQLAGWAMHESNITVVNASLESGRHINRDANTNELVVNNNLLDVYKNRLRYTDIGQSESVEAMNFLEFATQYDHLLKKVKVNGEEVQRLKPRKHPEAIAVRIYQKYSSNPELETYGLYCKYQLLRYKVWQVNYANCLGNDNIEDTTLWIDAWKLFLESPIGQSKVPDFSKELDNATAHYLQRVDDSDSSDEELAPDGENRDPRMNVQDPYMRNMACLPRLSPERPCNMDVQGEPDEIEHWSAGRSYFESDPRLAQFLDNNSLKNWLQHMKDQYVDQLPLRRRVFEESLNSKQSLAYGIVHRFSQGITVRQLFMRVAGVGGTGKTYLIDAICTMLNPDETIVIAPTGRASNNILGSTYHSFFAIYPGQDRTSGLKGNSLSLLQRRVAGKKYIILDEISMLDPRDLYCIHHRCQQARGVFEEPFGGMNFLIFGDFKQLEPVGGISLARNDTTSVAPGVMEGFTLFELFKTVITLTEVRRQSDASQVRFRETLERIRNCKATHNDYRFLSTRIRGADLAYTEEFERGGYIYIVPTREKVNTHNTNMLEELILNTQCRKLKLIARNSCAAARSKPAETYRGLESEVMVAIGARVMITNNIWTEMGLTNGAFGVVRHIIFAANVGPPNLPEAIIVEMDEPYSGPSLPGLPRHVVITPISICDPDSMSNSREQFPLALAWAITICKCQGMTCSKVIVNLGNHDMIRGSTYVALSRTTRIEDLMIDPDGFRDSERLTKLQLPMYLRNFDIRTIADERATMEKIAEGSL